MAAPSRRGNLLIGAITASMGAFYVLQGLGVINVGHSPGDAPRWVIAAAGGVFGLGGVAVMLHGAMGGGRTAQVVTALLAAGIVGGMAMIGTWVAFWPGERAFSGGFEFLGPKANSAIGRVAFGVGAVMTWAFFAGILWSLVRLTRPRPE